MILLTYAYFLKEPIRITELEEVWDVAGRQEARKRDEGNKEVIFDN